MEKRERTSSTHRRLRQHSDNGFTLVEMLVVMTIIGMFAVVAVPRFGQFSAQQRLSAAANRLETDLKLAQRHARFTSTSLTATFSMAAGKYELAGMSDPDHPSKPYIVKLNASPYEVKITLVNFGGDNKVIYDGFGAPDSNGTVTLAAGNLQRTLTFEGPDLTIVENPPPVAE